MKDSIEKNIKQSLEQHEMPYNSAAWTAMSAKLDAKMPVKPKTNFRYYAAASVAIIVAVASYLMLSEFNSDPQKELTKTASISEDNENPIQSNDTGETRNKTIGVDNDNTIIKSHEPNNSTEDVTINPVVSEENNNVQIDNLNEQNINDDSNGFVNHIESNNNLNKEELNDSEITMQPDLVIPKIKAVCVGEVVQVENKNDEALLVEGSDLHFIIPAHSTRNVRVKGTGKHIIKGLNSVNNETNFFVKESPSVDFTINTDTKFEGGIPITSVESTVPGQSFTWIANGRKSNGRTSEAHFYHKGNHDITLTVTGNNGCKASATKSVYIDNKYNLMAVNSFMPASNDTRKNRFMPYALTQRDVKFDLIIIDPIDGHVVYQTKDASAGWDGIDSKTGSMVSYESAYIWKVIIENPELNENNEYVGNIIPIDWR